LSRSTVSTSFDDGDGHGYSDADDWRYEYRFSLQLILLHSASRSLVIVKIGWTVVAFVDGCACDSGRVVILSDSVVADYAWFGGRLPLGSLCLCFSF